MGVFELPDLACVVSSYLQICFRIRPRVVLIAVKSSRDLSASAALMVFRSSRSSRSGHRAGNIFLSFLGVKDISRLKSVFNPVLFRNHSRTSFFPFETAVRILPQRALCTPVRLVQTASSACPNLWHTFIMVFSSRCCSRRADGACVRLNIRYH